MDFLAIHPTDREATHLDAISELLVRQAKPFVATIATDILMDVCRRAGHQVLPAGAQIVASHEEAANFFVVLSGSVVIEEPAVHHQDQATSTRKRLVPTGFWFHHLPFVSEGTKRPYGYSAYVSDAEQHGASLLLLPAADYTSILRRQIEREVRDAVALMHSRCKFFERWAEAALARLYFWFERRIVGADEDIVTQGDAADFCFIILSGTCNILREYLPGELETAPAPEAPAPSAQRRPSLRGQLQMRNAVFAASAAAAAAAADEAAASPPRLVVHRTAQKRPARAEQTALDRRNALLQVATKPRSSASSLESVAAASGGGRRGSFGRGSACDICAMTRAVSSQPGADNSASVASSAPVKPSFIAPAPAMRHLATVGAGDLIGEIGLLKQGARRIATVRAAEEVELLALDKRSFLGTTRGCSKLPLSMRCIALIDSLECPACGRVGRRDAAGHRRQCQLLGRVYSLDDGPHFVRPRRAPGTHTHMDIEKPPTARADPTPPPRMAGTHAPACPPIRQRCPPRALPRDAISQSASRRDRLPQGV